MKAILLFCLCRKWSRQLGLFILPKGQVTQTDSCSTAESQLPLELSWTSTPHSVFPWIFFRLVWCPWDPHLYKYLVSVEWRSFFGGGVCSVRGFRKNVELYVLGLWWGVRPCGMSRIAKSAGVMLEDCVGRKKPSLVHTDPWELLLRSATHQTVYRFSLGES